MDIFSRVETVLQHADHDPGERAIAPPIHPSVPFEAADADEFLAISGEPRNDHFYRRYGSPTQQRLQTLVAAIEGAETGLATASGMGAITNTFLALLSSGDHVVAQKSLYAGTLSFLQNVAPRFGIDTTFVDQTDTSAFERAVTPRTALIVLETPSNPLLQVTDLAAVSGIARQRGIRTMVDNTVATPINQRPLDLGIDLVMHSVTKSLSGHSDVQAGMVLGSSELVEKLWHTHIVSGSVISPFDAWLAVRGIRTLALRVEHQNRTALAVAEALAAHPAVESVNYPGLDRHPQHDLARRQMKGFGGLLSFVPRGGFSAAEQILAALRLPARSASLGGTRSLVVQPAAMWAQDLSEEQIAAAGVPAGLIRLAVGLESEHDLIADLVQALDQSAPG